MPRFQARRQRRGRRDQRRGLQGYLQTDGRDVRVQICHLYAPRVLLRHAQRLESHDLQRQGVLRVEALRHRSHRRPRRRRRLVLGRHHPWPAHQVHAGRGPRVRRGRFGAEAHHQRRLQPRFGRGGREPGRRQRQRPRAAITD